ncbi:uncharacterized protein JCM15063_001202 [Sporobolomyces koalae]|uniref:uncharacterized protein n=1 Tax=Sporobolomyces koalae TaxID=500713 RepID=UPI00317299B1
MADYWISRDKYFCKYCKIYIADDKPSRIQHETGLRHKGNYERYIRDIYKRGARDAKDKVEESKEMARIEAAAKAAMGIDSEAPSVAETQDQEPPVASTSKAKPPPPTPKPSASDPYANYTTAEFLGYKDDAAEQKKEEAELRNKEGTIGQWQKVLKPLKVRPIEHGGGEIKREPGIEERAPSPPRPRTGYFTEKKVDLDEDEFDPSKIGGGIKLKRKRLTLKEEQDLQQTQLAERDAARLKWEQEHSLNFEDDSSSTGRTGWQSTEVKAEPLMVFDEGSKPAVPLAGGVKAEEQPADVKPTPAAESGKTGFKKRKMHGAGTVRKK